MLYHTVIFEEAWDTADIRLIYSWFHIKGTWSVHSFNGDYLTIPEGTGSWGYLFHEIPSRSRRSLDRYKEYPTRNEIFNDMWNPPKKTSVESEGFLNRVKYKVPRLDISCIPWSSEKTTVWFWINTTHIPIFKNTGRYILFYSTSSTSRYIGRFMLSVLYLLKKFTN